MEHSAQSHDHKKSSLPILALSALGIVLGDIGTSPLYALRECFSSEYGLEFHAENVFGVLSLIFWTMVIIICVKYVGVVLRADNKGEGGILSLMALTLRTGKFTGNQNRRTKNFFIAIGIFGAALLYGDGIITPAISVLSAVEGLKLVTPVFEPYVVPITLFILNALFLMQRFGTAKIGVVFGPIIFIWFSVLAILGLRGIYLHPEILEAVNPIFAFQFIQENGLKAFFVLGSVVLVITGGEALYADMGHFGRKPIQLAWYFVAFPALVLNYFGQGAFLLETSEAVANPFYALAPKWGLIPLVILSTMATVIASQALISGIFSLTRQAIQLGYWPRLSIIHTSSAEIGQIYIPFINWSLFVGVVWLVINFQSSSNLAAAYGIAVTLTMLMTTILAFTVARLKWKWGLLRCSLLFGTFLIVDFAFLSANLIKVSHGGWFALVIGAAVYLLMTTWQKGRRILYAKLKDRSLSVEDFLQKMLREPPLRVPGTGIYMSGDPWGVPAPLLHNLKHNKVLHQRVAILSIQTKEVPKISPKGRVEITELTPNFYRIVASYGFMETPKMKHILEACRALDIHFKIEETTFVLGRETILPANSPEMPLWQERLFALMSKNAQRPTTFFRIPPNQVVEVGIQVEI